MCLSLDVECMATVRINPVDVAGWVFFVVELVKSLIIEFLLHWDLAVDEGELNATPAGFTIPLVSFVLFNQAHLSRKTLTPELTGASWSFFLSIIHQPSHPGDSHHHLSEMAMDIDPAIVRPWIRDPWHLL